MASAMYLMNFLGHPFATIKFHWEPRYNATSLFQLKDTFAAMLNRIYIHIGREGMILHRQDFIIGCLRDTIDEPKFPIALANFTGAALPTNPEKTFIFFVRAEAEQKFRIAFLPYITPYALMSMDRPDPVERPPSDRSESPTDDEPLC
jgi:hypothetical protein